MLETSARLLRLLSVLQTRRDWTGGELATRLGVSTRTIRKDMDRLRGLGYPVEARPGVAGGYRLGAGGTLPPLLLDDEEAVAVAVGLRTAASGSIAGIEETSVRALAKLQQVLPSRLRHRVSAFQSHTLPMPSRGPQVDMDVLTGSPARVETMSGCGSSTRPIRGLPVGARWSRTAFSTTGDAGTYWPGTWIETPGVPSGSTGSSCGLRPGPASPRVRCHPTTRWRLRWHVGSARQPGGTGHA